MLRDSFAETREYQRDQTKLAAEKAWEKSKAKGMQFNEDHPGRIRPHAGRDQTRGREFSPNMTQPKVKLFASELARIRSAK